MRRRLLLAAALALLATGCQVTTTVGIDARGDGSGAVRVAVGVDDTALARLPDLRENLRVDDLRRSGWTITGPARERDGRTWVRATKRFASPEQAGAVVGELSGDDGPLRDVRLERERSFLRTETRFRGTVDLRAGIEAFGDEDLRARLGGTSFGADAAELERRLGVALARVLAFRVAVRLPGDVASNAPVETDNGAEWRPTLGEEVVLEASAGVWNLRAVGAALAAAAAALVLAAVLVRRLTRRRARRGRPPPSPGGAPPGAAGQVRGGVTPPS